jgi:hypothetical protein
MKVQLAEGRHAVEQRFKLLDLLGCASPAVVEFAKRFEHRSCLLAQTRVDRKSKGRRSRWR